MHVNNNVCDMCNVAVCSNPLELRFSTAESLDLYAKQCVKAHVFLKELVSDIAVRFIQISSSVYI